MSSTTATQKPASEFPKIDLDMRLCDLRRAPAVIRYGYRAMIENGQPCECAEFDIIDYGTARAEAELEQIVALVDQIIHPARSAKSAAAVEA